MKYDIFHFSDRSEVYVKYDNHDAQREIDKYFVRACDGIILYTLDDNISLYVVNVDMSMDTKSMDSFLWCLHSAHEYYNILYTKMKEAFNEDSSISYVDYESIQNHYGLDNRGIGYTSAIKSNIRNILESDSNSRILVVVPYTTMCIEYSSFGRSVMVYSHYNLSNVRGLHCTHVVISEFMLSLYPMYKDKFDDDRLGYLYEHYPSFTSLHGMIGRSKIII